MLSTTEKGSVLWCDKKCAFEQQIINKKNKII